MTSKYTATIIKPDAHRDGIVEMILSDFENGGLHVVLRKDEKIDRKKAEIIYRDRIGKHYYEHSIASILGDQKNPCITLLILRSEHGDATELASVLKGRASQNGIRNKYRIHSKEELERKGLSNWTVWMELLKDRLHVPDTSDLSLELMLELLSERDLKDIEQREPELFYEMEKFQDARRENRIPVEYKRIR